MSRQVLVISPHFDDEAIGCGGTLLRHVAQGDAVRLLFVTDGCADGESGERGGAVRKAEASNVALRLGASEPTFLDAPEGFVSTNDVGLERRLVQAIRRFGPEVVYCTHAADGHPDHEATATLAERACRKAGIGAWPELGSKHHVSQLRLWEVWTPMRRDSIDLVVDITEEVEAKDELVQLYASQQSSMNYVAMSRHLAAYRSAMFGAAGYAECFDVKKVVVDRW